MSNASGNWQNIIWREWRNSEDPDYADRLFDLVADEPAGWEATATMVLLGMLYGAITGLLLGLAAMNWGMRSEPEEWKLLWTALLPFVFGGWGTGGTIALMIRICAGRRLTWRIWLERVANLLPAGGVSRQPWGDLRRTTGLGGPSVWFQLALCTLFVAGAGLISFMFLGLLTSWVVDLLHGERFIDLSWIIAGGLVAGLINVLALGRDVGLVGDLVGGLILALVLGLGGIALGMASGLVIGLVFVLISGLVRAMVVELGETPYPYEHRSLWFWWRHTPHSSEVESALRTAAEEEWAEPLRRLEETKKQPGLPDSLIAALQSRDWVERFTARYALMRLGKAAIKPLAAIVLDKYEIRSLRLTAIWLLRNISPDSVLDRWHRRVRWQIR
jgi:hypothetical protein